MNIAQLQEAIALIDAGDAAGLARYLADKPDLAVQRFSWASEGYFRNPALLDCVAENPVRRERLPSNIVDVANVILDAGAAEDRGILDSALALVASGRVAREAGAQVPLIDVLCARGADANAAMPAALAHGEFDAVTSLLRHGAEKTLMVAAGLGEADEVRRLLPGAGGLSRRAAVALAAQFGRFQALSVLLGAGESPNGFNPDGFHEHSTPLHQAALGGHVDTVRLLLERGADRNARDTAYGGTPAEWAEHGGHAELARTLTMR
jgi:peptide-methionine (S)-S-oxide reductase